jgi:hypothetical protein
MSKPDAAVAAIEFALSKGHEGLEFLSSWMHGDFDVIRQEWPDAPATVFQGADPMHQSLSLPAAPNQVASTPEGSESVSVETSASQQAMHHYMHVLRELQELAKNAPYVTQDWVQQVATMDEMDMRRRLIRSHDWHGHFARSLDGIPEIRNMPGAGIDGCRSHKEVRAVVLGLLHQIKGQGQRALCGPSQGSHELQFLKQIVGVAIAGLYEHYPQDVAKAFDTQTLQDVLETTKPLGKEHVEILYRRAWDLLCAVPSPTVMLDSTRSETQPAEPSLGTGVSSGAKD